MDAGFRKLICAGLIFTLQCGIEGTAPMPPPPREMLPPPTEIPPAPPPPTELPVSPVSFVLDRVGFYRTFHSDKPVFDQYNEDKLEQFKVFNNRYRVRLVETKKGQQAIFANGGDYVATDWLPEVSPGVFQTSPSRFPVDDGGGLLEYATIPKEFVDWNGDGIADLLAFRYWMVGTDATGYTPVSKLSIALGAADGTYDYKHWKDTDNSIDRFRYEDHISRCAGGCLAWYDSLWPADVNSDGKMDLILALPGLRPTHAFDNDLDFIAVLYGRGDGTFETTPTIIPCPMVARSITTGDVDQDGFIDIVVTHELINRRHDQGVSILFGGPGNQFTRQQLATGDQSYLDAQIVDINHDNRLDLVVSSDSVLNVFLNGGTRTSFVQKTWTLPPPSSDPYPNSSYEAWIIDSKDQLVVQDMDGDGNQDVLLLRRNDPPNSEYIENPLYPPGLDPSVLIVYRGDGQGGFFAPQFLDVGFGSVSFYVRDLNGDGLPDVIVGHAADYWQEGNYYTAGISVHMNHTMARSK